MIRALVRKLIPAPGRARIFEIWIERLRPLAYRGRRVHCPCCASSFRRFLATGPGGRVGAVCPKCRSYERHRLTWLLLRRRPDLLGAGRTLLHFAPAPVIRKKLRALPGLRYVCADLNPAKATVRTDITRTAFPADRFDAILCNHVLEHITDDDDAIAELHRVLRPGGLAIVQVPFDRSRERTFEDPSITDPAERRRLFGQEDHVRLYGRDLKDRLERAGFSVTVKEVAEMLSPRRQAFYGLLDEPVFVCRKTSASRPVRRRRS